VGAKVRIHTAAVIALLLSAPAPTAAEPGERPFSLELEEIDLQPADPRTRARLARWNSDPMARVAMHMASEQARMLGGNQPGAERMNAMVVSVRFQRGLAAALVVASSASGVELYSRRMAVIDWPWTEDEADTPALPLDEQLTILLGDRLESR
jgi:hypothetical protein